MANIRMLLKSVILRNFNDVFAIQKRFSQFPPHYVKPIFKKEKQQALEKEGILPEMRHVPILPAGNCDTSSEFHDELTSKFTNYIMRKGRKLLARDLMEKTLETIKRLQIMKYHRADPEDKDSIELDPKIILSKAVENACPVMELREMKRGGIKYQVPVPLRPARSRFLGIKWLLEAGNEKDRSIRLPKKLALELIDASQNQGRVITRKKDLYKQCELNRAYAHYRWM